MSGLHAIELPLLAEYMKIVISVSDIMDSICRIIFPMKNKVSFIIGYIIKSPKTKVISAMFVH